MDLRKYTKFVIGKNGSADQLNTYLLSKAILIQPSQQQEEPFEEEPLPLEEEPFEDAPPIEADDFQQAPDSSDSSSESSSDSSSESESDAEEVNMEQIIDFIASRYENEAIVRSRLSRVDQAQLDEKIGLRGLDCEYAPPKNLDLKSNEVVVFADPDFLTNRDRTTPSKLKGYLSFDSEGEDVRLHYVCSGDVFPTPFEVFLDACRQCCEVVKVKSSLSGLLFFSRYGFVKAEDDTNPINLWRSFLKKNHKTQIHKDDLKNPQSATYKKFRNFVGSESVELVLNLKKRKVSARTVKTRRSSSTKKK